MRKPRVKEARLSSRPGKHVAASKVPDPQVSETSEPNQPLLVFDEGEHLRGLWVTLGLADVAD